MSYWANLFPGRRPYLVVREPMGHNRYLGNDELDHGFNGSFGSLSNKRLSIKNIDAKQVLMRLLDNLKLPDALFPVYFGFRHLPPLCLPLTKSRPMSGR